MMPSLLLRPRTTKDGGTVVQSHHGASLLLLLLLLRPRTTKDGGTLVLATVNGPLEGGFAIVVLHMVSRVWAAGAGGAGGRCD